MNAYAKGLIAAIGALAQAVNVTALPDSWHSWAAVVFAALTALGVYQVPNASDTDAA